MKIRDVGLLTHVFFSRFSAWRPAFGVVASGSLAYLRSLFP